MIDAPQSATSRQVVDEQKAEKRAVAQTLNAKGNGKSVDKREDNEDIVRKTRLEHAQCVLASLFGRSKLVENPRTKNKKNKYQNFVLIDSEDPTTLISSMHAVKEASDFFKMPSGVASHLVPHIRLFGVDKKNNKTEYFFDTSDRIASQIAAGVNTQSLNSAGQRSISEKKGTDAGLLEVQIEDLTSQPAEEGNTLIVKIKLFFKSFGTFTTILAPNKRPFSDLVERKSSSQGYDPLDTQAILHIGYSVPNIKNPSQLGISGQKFKAVKKAIQKSTRVLRLHLREHSLSFEEDGTLELELIYNGAIDGIYRDPRTDLLMTTKGQERIASLRSKIKEIRESSPGEGMSEADTKEVEKLNSIISKTTNNQKDDAMSRFMMELFGQVDFGVNVNVESSYIKKITVPTALLGAINRKENLASKDIKQRTADDCATYNRLLEATEAASGNSFSVKDKLSAAEQMKKAIADNKANNRQDYGEHSFSDQRKERNKAIEEANGKFSILYGTQQSPERLARASKIVEKAIGDSGEFKTDDFMDIAFFHYGDILEVALNILRKPNGPFHDAYVKTGMMDTFPTPILGPVLMREETCGGQKMLRAGSNLADVPISVDFFIDFMTNNFIKPARSNLLLRDFISMLNKSILPGALGETCRMESSGQNVQYAHSVSISVKKYSQSDECLGYPIADGRRGQNYISNQYARKRLNNLSHLSADTKPIATKEYNLIYIPNYVFTDLTGNQSEDMSKGVHHLIAGTADTPIKTFSVDANQQPFMAEALAFPKEGRGNLGGDISGGVRYDISIEMLGNTFFRVGYPFYFNLSSLTLGSTNNSESLASRLGIGGYYQCDKINYIATSSEFITKIKALYMGNKKQLVGKKGKIGETGPKKEPEVKEVGFGDVVDAVVDIF